MAFVLAQQPINIPAPAPATPVAPAPPVATNTPLVNVPQIMFGKTALVNPKKTTPLVKSALYSTPIILAPINLKAPKNCLVL